MKIKVYIYGAEYECPYEYEWGDKPLSDIGDMLAYSEERSHEISVEMYEKWRLQRRLFDEVQEDMLAIVERDKHLRKPL